MKQTLQPGYGKVVVTGLSMEQAVERAKALLKEEGFGVLCEIDVRKTLQEKLGADFRPYRILGACNPGLAHEALLRDPQLGLLLPCNLVVQEEDNQTVVSAIDALAMLSFSKTADLTPIAQEANERLSRVLERMAS
ncbi:MAG TPA: DUF302 domain-containing protein [Candidatus Baltobacteraceae bacterium]|nr:DUF302 domain-containing protein [Candidatus Baltobacteraceae bacterium]